MTTADPNPTPAARALRELATELERVARSSMGAEYLRHAARMARSAARAEDFTADRRGMADRAPAAPAPAPGLAGAVARLAAAGGLGQPGPVTAPPEPPAVTEDDRWQWLCSLLGLATGAYPGMAWPGLCDVAAGYGSHADPPATRQELARLLDPAVRARLLAADIARQEAGSAY